MTDVPPGKPPTARSLDIVLRSVGVVYMLACLGMAMNSALYKHGLPSLVSGASFDIWPLGDDGPRVTAALAAAVLVAALAAGLVARGLNALQWTLTLVVCLWFLAPAISLHNQTGLWDARILALAGSAGGLVLAAGLAGARTTRWTLFVAGSLWAIGSLWLGLSALDSAGGVVASEFEISSNDRYTLWLQALGFDVAAGSVKALVGLSLHRQLLGMLLAMFLVLQVRHLVSVRFRWWITLALTLVGPVATAAALLWSLSRTSIAAAAAGLLVGLIPIQRIRVRLAVPGLAVAVLVIMAAPLILRDRVSSAGDGTLSWRGQVWEGLLDDPALTSWFGLGPLAQLTNGAVHAHNQLLEALASGGWIGLTALVAFVALGALVAVVAAGSDGRAAFALLITAAVISQFEVLSSPINLRELNPGLLVLVATLASSAGLIRDRPQRADDELTGAGGSGVQEAVLSLPDGAPVDEKKLMGHD